MFEPMTRMQSLLARSRGWSEAGLVLDRENAQAPGEELLDQIVLLVVERCAAQRGHRLEMVDRRSGGILFHEVAVARVLDQSSDAVHRPAEWLLLPPVAMRR